ncbi:MAG: Holliday junction resolvase [Euryarchaeota archaeon]|nr:Holliday junction resolvase [Euryarchaeota archaeon]
MVQGAQYERELRHVLAGIPDGVRAVTRSCTESERAQARLVIEKPFLVVRAAGSGIEGSGDLLALRGDICFPIEVKTSKEKKIYLSGRLAEQYSALENIGKKCGLMPLYAFRLKGVRGDSWRIFRIDSGELEGKLSILARRIPVCPLTSTGKPHLFWDQGMPLHKFLALVCRETEQKKSVFNPIQERTITEEITHKLETETPHWMKGFIR